jgi:hypothetical protein
MNQFENNSNTPQQIPNQEELRDLTENEAQILTAAEDGFRKLGTFMMPDSIIEMKKSMIRAMETKIPVLNFEGSLRDARSGVTVTLPVTFDIRFADTYIVSDSNYMTSLTCTATFSLLYKRENVKFFEWVYFKGYEAEMARRLEIQNTPKTPEEIAAESYRMWKRDVCLRSNDFRMLVTKLGRLEGAGGFKMFGKQDVVRGSYKEVHNYNNEYSIKVADSGNYLEIYSIDKDKNGELEYNYYSGFDQSSPDYSNHDMVYLNEKISELGIDFQFPLYPN